MAVVLTVLALTIGIITVRHLLYMNVEGDRRGVVDRVMRRVPLQSVKIIVTVWQILTQVRVEVEPKGCHG